MDKRKRKKVDQVFRIQIVESMFAAVWPRSLRRKVRLTNIATTSGGLRHSFADLASEEGWKVGDWWRFTNNVLCLEKSEVGASLFCTRLIYDFAVWQYVEHEYRPLLSSSERSSWVYLEIGEKINAYSWYRGNARTCNWVGVACYCAPVIAFAAIAPHSNAGRRVAPRGGYRAALTLAFFPAQPSPHLQYMITAGTGTTSNRTRN